MAGRKEEPEKGETGGVSYGRLSFGLLLLKNIFYYVLFFTIIYVLITLKTITNHNHGIMEFYNQKIREMKATGRVSNVVLPPLEQLQLSGSDHARGLYQNLRMIQALHTGNIDAMIPIAGWFGERYTVSVAGQEALCANVVFYYSYYCQMNPYAQEMARKYFDKVKVELEKGLDSNDKRIYAYYMYYVEHDANRALQLVREGLELLPKYPKQISELWEGEEKWLRHLQEQILQKQEIQGNQ